MSILLAQADEGGGRVSVAEFENMFWLFAVAGNETLRNGLPGACIALLEHPRPRTNCGPTRPCCPSRPTRCCAGGRR